jgi:hypothetical protein
MAGLTPGVLDEAAVEFFANGHCASMALALHWLTGWDVVCFDVPSQQGHAMVHSPLGYLDASGIVTVEGFANGRALRSKSEVLIHKGDSCEFAEQNLQLAMPFARALLNRYFYWRPLEVNLGEPSSMQECLWIPKILTWSQPSASQGVLVGRKAQSVPGQ